MDKLEMAIAEIKNCDLCNGQGALYYGNGEDFFDYEICECNPHELILDHNKNVVFDSGTLFSTQEAN